MNYKETIVKLRNSLVDDMGEINLNLHTISNRLKLKKFFSV